VQKYGRAGQATDDIITARMRFTCCINEATDTNSEHAIFIAFSIATKLREHASLLPLCTECLSCHYVGTAYIRR
jgi:hypothetical protein